VAFTLSGNGVLNGNQLSMTVVFNVQGVPFTCIYTLSKQ
jgi:hypothetical protein